MLSYLQLNSLESICLDVLLVWYRMLVIFQLEIWDSLFLTSLSPNCRSHIVILSMLFWDHPNSSISNWHAVCGTRESFFNNLGDDVLCLNKYFLFALYTGSQHIVIGYIRNRCFDSNYFSFNLRSLQNYWSYIYATNRNTTKPFIITILWPNC